MKSSLAKIIAFVCLMAVAVGCRSIRTLVTADYSHVTLADRFEAFQTDTACWQTLALSAKVKISAPVKESCTVKIFMVKNELIYLSFRAYGVEGAVAKVTPDSVAFYNKSDKILIETSFDNFFGNSAVSLADVQNILIGRPAFSLLDYTTSLPKEKGRNEWTVPLSSVHQKFAGMYVVDSRSNLPSALTIDAPKSSLDITYYKWASASDMVVPTGNDLRLSVMPTDERLILSMKLSPGSVKVNEGRAPKWRVGRDATREDFNQIVNQLIYPKR